MKYLLPNDTAEVLSKNNNKKSDNMNLLFNKYIHGWQKENGNYTLGNEKCKIFKSISGFDDSSVVKILREVIGRRENLTANKTLCKTIDNMVTQWRLAIGFGSSGPLETGLTLHHLYGYPYIPATAVKGIARAAAHVLDEELHKLSLGHFDNYLENEECSKLLNETDEEKLKELLTYKPDSEPQIPRENDLTLIRNNAPKLNLLRDIFGSKTTVGNVIFHDGLPIGFPKLDVDVLTPHYGNYYLKGDTPGDWMQPIPSFFLTVAENTPFTFSLAARYNNADSDELLTLAEEFLVEGLKQLGVGGKTSSGYGYLDDVKTRENELKKLKETKILSVDLPKGQSIATITKIDGKKMEVDVDGAPKPILCSGVNPKGLGLVVKDKIIVTLNIERKSKVITSCKYERKIN